MKSGAIDTLPAGITKEITDLVKSAISGAPPGSIQVRKQIRLENPLAQL